MNVAKTLTENKKVLVIDGLDAYSIESVNTVIVKRIEVPINLSELEDAFVDTSDIGAIQGFASIIDGAITDQNDLIDIINIIDKAQLDGIN
jgi:hypothetical protein